MEDILGKIMKDASSTKHAAVKQSCLESQELLAKQQSLMKYPPFEIRKKLLGTFRLALETKDKKLISHAMSGFQRMIWDKSFQSVFESGYEENWFPCQLLKAVESLYTHTDEVQLEILKILLNMTNAHSQHLADGSIAALTNICVNSYSHGSAAVKTAAQATVIHTLTLFCFMIQDTSPPTEGSDESDVDSFTMLECVSEELYPILHFICEKLKNGRSADRKAGAPLILQCILCVLKNIKCEVSQNAIFLNIVWQELCPPLVAFLGSPKTDKNIVSSQKSCEGAEIGRGSACLATAPSCHTMEAKTIYSIAIELVRLVGSVGSLRPVLESLFHRMLLYPSVQHRLEALKAVKEMFSKPELLLELAAPPVHATSDKDWISLDLDLIKICIDSLGECCHSSDNSICYASVSCVLALLNSLEEIYGGERMKAELVSSINSQFGTLESSDYKGAKSERWLKTKLRFLLIEKEKKGILKNKRNDTSASTDASTENSPHKVSFNDSDEDEFIDKDFPPYDVDNFESKVDAMPQEKEAIVTKDEDQPILEAKEAVVTKDEDKSMLEPKEAVVTKDDDKFMLEEKEAVVTEDEDKPMFETKEEAVTKDEDKPMLERKETIVTKDGDTLILEAKEAIVTKDVDKSMLEPKEAVVTKDDDKFMLEEKEAVVTEDEDKPMFETKEEAVTKDEDKPMLEEEGAVVTEDEYKPTLEEKEAVVTTNEDKPSLEEKEALAKDEDELTETQLDHCIKVQSTEDIQGSFNFSLPDKKISHELAEVDTEEKLRPSQNSINLDLEASSKGDCLTIQKKVEDIMSPVTESAEDALNYVSSCSSEALSEELNDDFAEMNDDLTDNIERLKKVPRTLLGQADAGKEERERIEKLCLVRLEFALQERQNARSFIQTLQTFLPELLAIRSSIEADQALQEFSSKTCEKLWQAQQNIKENSGDTDNVTSHITILNADGIYLALYSALLLNLKLIRNNYYKDSSSKIPLTEQQFIEEVHGSGVLVYLSATWLAELYQQVLAINLLEQAGYKPASIENYALINLLSDVDGLGNSLPGTQQLADYRRLERAIVNSNYPPNVEAGRKFCRRILTCCWETVLEVLSVLLNGTNSCGISSTIGFLLGTEGAKEEHRRTKDAIAESLDGLQKAAKLCNTLGLQASCSAVFAQLAVASCPLSEDSIFPQASHIKRSLMSGRNKSLRLHESHLLSMDVILSRGLELGSHSPDCWKYVFQCCLFVLQLENTYFSGHGNVQSILSRPIRQSACTTDKYESSLMYETSSNDYRELSCMPGSSIPQKLDAIEIVKKNRNSVHSSGVIKDQHLLEAIEALSQQVDRLFEEAASRLNLSALISFLVELCAASQTQLFTQSYIKFTNSSSHGNNLLLYHLGDVMLRCARGGRPLIHVMRAWSVVAPHFVEAACHKDNLISKKGVTTIHDIVSALLSSNSELSHFHFNEALFKPFENLLCLELCDTDIQEQIVSSICEFVEGCTTEIRSGWRPLFGALRAVRIPSTTSDLIESGIDKEHVHHLRVVLDVFEAFLGTDNMFVFAYAAVDCLLCLLKHVKGPAELEDPSTDIQVDQYNCHGIPLDMCLAALKYLVKCSAILSSMYTIPTCPIFNSANRIQLYSEPCLVDPVIPGMQMVHFEDPESFPDESPKVSNGAVNLDIEINNIPSCSEIPVTLSSLDKHTGIIHVWFLLLEGLAGALATCPKRYQSHTMESLFNMLRGLKDIPGPEFGIYCVNHLLLPMLQNWLRRTTKIYRGWENFATNFKQCCGLATDLIVDYVQHIADSSTMKLSSDSGVRLMIQQLFLVLTECVGQTMEIISRLGCACIRHAVMSAGKYFTSDIWDIVCFSLQRACLVSLHSVKQLMVCFHIDSENFYGDVGEVKVAARRDCTVQDSERLKHLSHQVFLLDCQQAGNTVMKSTCIEDDERSFTFLLFPPGLNSDDADASIIRVPFCSLVVGLLSHQILLQTIGSMLLQGTKYMLPTLMTLLPSENTSSLLLHPSSKPGFLSLLSTEQLKMLLLALENSYETACNFDLRPGLKFLVQKVAQTNVATNLYKQAGVSWSILMVVLFELCMSNSPLSLEYIKSKIYTKNSNPVQSTPEETPNTTDISKNVCEVNSNEVSNPDTSPFNEFVLLKEKFKDLCETYTEHTIDKDGLASIVDKMSDQPIFFLAAPADEMIDFMFSSTHSDSQASKNGTSDICYDSSDSEDLATMREEDVKDKIYTIATEHTINSLICEYKKRKNQHSMPSKLKEKLTRKTSSGSRRKESSDSSIPEDIVIQRRNSIMKDGEAHLQVFKQLIQSVLDLHQSLDNEKFKAFLPIFFPGVQFLVAYTSDGELRLSISEWLQRLAVCCDIFPSIRPD